MRGQRVFGDVYWKLCSDRECKRMHADPDLVSLSSRSPHDPNIGPTDMPPPYDAEAIITVDEDSGPVWVVPTHNASKQASMCIHFPCWHLSAYPSSHCQGPGRVLTTTLLLMVFSHKFTNNQYHISTLWRVVNSLLTSKPRCQSGPGVGRDHASSKNR